MGHDLVAFSSLCESEDGGERGLVSYKWAATDSFPHIFALHAQRVQLEAYHRDRLLERLVLGWRIATEEKKKREGRVSRACFM